MVRRGLIQIHGGIEPVRIQSDDIRQEFPRPADRLLLKVISERKVPKHLKKRAMTGRLSYILNVPGADALLASGHPLARRNLLSGKVWLQRRHA